ncbi:hypothetical protein I317_04742 [Kwoniella heveanensis CBS 569]|uniref:Uncharacterized protein n=1 Tax=Kwoniella heveanensis BCC8398 TaxID=1296120 RepID=A0A1B9GZN6_9TREE|nr:hypothetical protein I316_01735 [Kwoniella heveanensis BCC8398]OCF41441.1 hypothetical protein I317_04742 [Kwoniella heveanensis CBS 569]
MSLRASLLRASANARLVVHNRSLTTATLSARPLAIQPLPVCSNLLGRRALNTSQSVNVTATQSRADGGVEEPPQGGFNVDKDTRMDS